MSVKLEEMEVHYCDICGRKETTTDRTMKCWKCGRDCCNQHIHLVNTVSGARMHTYLCDDDREEMVSTLRALFQDFSMDRARGEKEEQGGEAS